MAEPGVDKAPRRLTMTESMDDRFAHIDEMPVAQLAALMNEADAEVPAAVRQALPSIVTAIEATAVRMATGGRLVYVGAGTPGRIGVLDASECPPTFDVPPELIFAIIAGGRPAITTAVEGAEDDATAGAAAIDAASIAADDTVIGIAASGRTPFVVSAVSRARERGALTIGFACNADSPLGDTAEHRIEVIVGPEVISGSTRLKAGTAQKLVLNMFSTITMVGLGKTYGNLMVDMLPTNAKLRERAVQMVTSIASCDRETAIAALARTDYKVKLAVLLIERGLDAGNGRDVLESTGGRLKGALTLTASTPPTLEA